MEFVEEAFTIRLNSVYKKQILSSVTNMKGSHKIVQISRGCTLGTWCSSLPSVDNLKPLEGIVSFDVDAKICRFGEGMLA